jgi:hypothetical protein
MLAVQGEREVCRVRQYSLAPPHIVHFGRVYARLRFTCTVAVAETVAWESSRDNVFVDAALVGVGNGERE